MTKAHRGGTTCAAAGSPTATSGTPQHVAVSGSRGNVTTIAQLVQGSTVLGQKITYYDTGTVNTSIDVNGAVTTFNYSSASCGNSFPTSISEPLSMSRSMAWNCTGGVQASATDENNQTTSVTWNDPFFWRSAATNFPDGGQTSITYNSATSVTSTTKMNSTQSIVGTVLLDGLGRTKQTQLYDPQGTDYVDTTYDSLGRVASVSNPHRSTTSLTDGTTIYGYDALGRATSVTLQEGSVSSLSYSGNTLTATDPAGKKRQSTYDSLGRLTQVMEDPGGYSYITTYAYDALSNLTNVVQNGSRQRSFAYDGLSRLISETNPESGTITYGYDASGNTGDLTSRIAPAPNQTGSATVTTTYSYDLLHRLTQKLYTGGTVPTPTAHFLYDLPYNWHPLSNTVGRMSEAYIDGSPWAGTIHSYDSVGRVVLNNQCTPYNCGTSDFALNYTYDLAGNMISYTNGAGVTFTQSFDTAGRVTGLTSSYVDAQHPATLATVDSSVGYYPASAIRKMTFGNGLIDTWAFNNRLQPCRYNTNSSGTALGTCADAIPSGSAQDYNLGFNAGAADNGDVASITATGTQNFNRSYAYDALNRVQSMSDTNTSQTCRGLSWAFDAWGNRTAQNVTAGTCWTSAVTVNNKNQLVGPPYQYDAAGNMTADGNHTYTYDAENRLTAVDSGNTASYVYDALGRRVHRAGAGVPLATDYVYDLSGNVVAEFAPSCSGAECFTAGYAYLASQIAAEYRNATTYFVHGDHLGSARLVSGVGQNLTPNAGFEQGMTNWLPYTGSSIVTDATRAHSGNNYLQISTSTGSEATNSQYVAVTPGQVVNFGGWAYRESGTTGYANWKLLALDANHKPVAYPNPSPFNITAATWTFQQGSYTVPSGVAYVQLYCEIYQPTSATVARFDDGFLVPTIVQNLDYLPFGEINSTDSGVSTHKFTGDERDAETNLDHTQFRQYTSSLARWMTPDPAGLAAVDPTNPQSWNRYAYVLDNPVDLIDPSGLAPCSGSITIIVTPTGSTMSQGPVSCGGNDSTGGFGGPGVLVSSFHGDGAAGGRECQRAVSIDPERGTPSQPNCGGNSIGRGGNSIGRGGNTSGAASSAK